MDKYDKLTEKFFNYLQNNYIAKNNIPEPFQSKKDVYEYFEKTMNFFMRGVPSTPCLSNLGVLEI